MVTGQGMSTVQGTIPRWDAFQVCGIEDEVRCFWALFSELDNTLSSEPPWISFS